MTFYLHSLSAVDTFTDNLMNAQSTQTKLVTQLLSLFTILNITIIYSLHISTISATIPVLEMKRFISAKEHLA